MRTGEFTLKEDGERGFTLMELLIVVAIIGVLVAIAIPLFTTQLERSREAVDIANSRSAIAVAAAGYMDGTLKEGETYYYDLSGSFTTTKPEPYGRGTASDAGTTFPDNEFLMSYASRSDYTQSVIVAKLDEGDTYPTVKWDPVGISVATATDIARLLTNGRSLGLHGTDFWSDPKGGNPTWDKDVQNSALINQALRDAGFDPDNVTYQSDSDDRDAIFVTLDGRVTADMLGESVRVIRYDKNSGEITEGTMTVVNSAGHWRSNVGVGNFQAN